MTSIRAEEDFDLFWENVIKHGERLEADKPALPRKRRQPKTMTDYFGYGTGDETVYSCPKDYYRRQYFEAFDNVINCIEERFDQEDFQMYASMEHVLLQATKGETYVEELREIVEFYKEDLDESVLRSQLQTLTSNFKSIEGGNVTFAIVRTFLQNLSPGMKSLLSQVIRMTKLVLAAAATNSTSERSFSAMRRAKSYLQNTMGQQRLNNIMILHIHKERTDKLRLTEIANEFVRDSEARLRRFGRFEEVNWCRRNVSVKSQSVQVSSA